MPKTAPLTEVLDRISQLGSLRYSYENNRLHVERDLPYAKNYLVNFLIAGEIWEEVETNIDELLSTDSAGGSVSSNKLANIITVFCQFERS